MDDVRDNPAAGRFELIVDDHLAELVYVRSQGRLELVHTEVPEALGGRGLGGTLVRAALEVAERDGLSIVPTCPFARRWLEGHPDEAAKVTILW
jgi:predicted GNAT family acetyltransferase